MADERRPRVVVEMGLSVDGRIAFRKDQLWFDEDTPGEWESVERPRTRPLEESRSQLIESLYAPQAVLHGSGSLARSTAGPVAGLPPADPPDVLYADFLPEEVDHRPGHAKWFTCVDSRGRVHWDLPRDDGAWDVLVLVSKATPAPYLALLRHHRQCSTCSSPRTSSAGRARRRSSTARSSRRASCRRGCGCSSSTPSRTAASGCATRWSATPPRRAARASRRPRPSQ